ncbi:RNA polymerase sigma factor [Microbacteriaceae bacterium VKM Ac-2855]|nr:RNA polymerase sigma factor [Microbacteriaceae bacterium VKM Ac-2855]
MSPPPKTRAQLFSELYEREYLDIVRFLRRRAHPERADDLAHEAFLVAWRRFDSLPPHPNEARAWLFTIARNCLLNERRGQDRHDALIVRIGAAAELTSAASDEEVAARLDLAAAWERLSPPQQEAIALTAWEGLTAIQAARVTGSSPVAFRVRLHRARAALRGHLTAPSPHSIAERPALEQS